MMTTNLPNFPSSRWKFGYQTTVVSNSTSSAVLATQTTPSIGSVTNLPKRRFGALAPAAIGALSMLILILVLLATLARTLG